MKKLLIYLKGYEKETVLAPLFKMLEALFELFVPLVMAAVIDTGIGGSNRGYIVRMCLILVALGVIGLTWTYPEPLLYRDGQDRYLYTDDPYD